MRAGDPFGYGDLRWGEAGELDYLTYSGPVTASLLRDVATFEFGCARLIATGDRRGRYTVEYWQDAEMYYDFDDPRWYGPATLEQRREVQAVTPLHALLQPGHHPNAASDKHRAAAQTAIELLGDYLPR